MVKKLADMSPFLSGGGGGGGDEEEEEADEKRGAWGGEGRKYLNGTVPHRIVPPESEEEIEEDAVEGQHLYLNFLNTQVVDAGLHLPPGVFPDDSFTRISAERMIDWTRAGQELRLMADAFARSPERESVRTRAKAMSKDINSLTCDNFVKLLQALFSEGEITRERILLLFFFCADVALEALRKGYRETFLKLITWTLDYISTGVAEWVHINGGWGVVLRSSLNIVYQVTACCAFIAFCAACVVYIRRHA